jgi:hypothetical protein
VSGNVPSVRLVDKAQAESKKGAEQGKELLRKRLG